MGHYTELEEKNHNRSTYKQMNNVTGSQFFLYYAGGFIDGWWLVSATNKMYAGELRLNMTKFRDEDDKNLPPTEGVVWEYFDRTRREWVEDPSMTAGPFSPACGPVTVTLKGGAEENQQKVTIKPHLSVRLQSILQKCSQHDVRVLSGSQMLRPM